MIFPGKFCVETQTAQKMEGGGGGSSYFSQSGNARFSFSDNAFGNGRLMAMMEDMDGRLEEYEREMKGLDHFSNGSLHSEDSDLKRLPSQRGEESQFQAEDAERNEKLISKRMSGMISPAPSHNGGIRTHRAKTSAASMPAEIVQSSDDHFSLEVIPILFFLQGEEEEGLGLGLGKV